VIIYKLEKEEAEGCTTEKGRGEGVSCWGKFLNGSLDI